MPRPRKRRNVCCLPQFNEFVPVRQDGPAGEVIVMTVDEYESIRLIDHEGFSQEECSDYMNVARTTAQQIYAGARKKIAHALVDGLPIKIEGGDYHICNGNGQFCGRGACRRHHGRGNAPYRTGGKNMMIAIPLDDSKQNVCVSFGRAPYFLFHNAETNTDEILENPAAQAQGGAGIKAAQFVVDHQADTLITLRCGENASEVLLSAKVAIYKSNPTLAAENIKLLAEEKLNKLESFHPGFHGAV